MKRYNAKVQTMKKIQTELKWAFIFIAVSLGWMVLERLLGWHDRYLDYHIYLTNLFAIPAIYVFYLALRDKKRNDYKGAMTFSQGMISGLLISVIVAIFSPFTQWIISNVITPHYFDNVIVRSVELGYYASTAEAQAHFNYANYAKQSVIGALFMGLITTFIVMLFVRTKKPDSPHQQSTL